MNRIQRLAEYAVVAAYFAIPILLAAFWHTPAFQAALHALRFQP